MFARLADGTWVVGPHGTVVETSHTPATAVIDGRVVICANSLDMLEINRYIFIAEWRGAARSARAAEAIDVIYNHLDKPSGFGYYTGLFAV